MDQEMALEPGADSMDTGVCREPWKYAVPPFRIAGNLYFVGNRDVSVYLIDTGGGLVLIDSGYPQTLYLLIDSIHNLGFDPRNISRILHTHAHYDHIGGTQALRKLSGCEVALGKADLSKLSESPELTYAPEYGCEFTEAFEVTHPIASETDFRLGDTEFRILPTPGHTEGCCSIFFDLAWGGRILKAGLFGGEGLNTLEWDYLRTYGLPSGLREDFLKSLLRVEREWVDLTLCGHPYQSRQISSWIRAVPSQIILPDRGEWNRRINALRTAALELFEHEGGVHGSIRKV